jgi:hypothetical protein
MNMMTRLALAGALALGLAPMTASAQGFPQGYFGMTTQFREGANECLESRSAGNGAAFMDVCQNVSGQLWRAIPAGNGYFRLTTQFREGANECLEGSRRDAGPIRMDVCQNVSGQLWRFFN